MTGFYLPDSYYDPPEYDEDYDQGERDQCDTCAGVGVVALTHSELLMCADCDGEGVVPLPEPDHEQDEPDPDLAWKERHGW